LIVSSNAKRSLPETDPSATPSRHLFHHPRYNARLHFGKNWDRTFTHPKCPVRARYPQFDDLLALQARVDPQKVFEPPLFTKIVSGAGPNYYPSCATDYECFCEEDVHCAPEFKCVPSFALPQFKVCKPPADWDMKLVKSGQTNTMGTILKGTLGVASSVTRAFGGDLTAGK
jgi:hypothetical protein